MWRCCAIAFDLVEYLILARYLTEMANSVADTTTATLSANEEDAVGRAKERWW